MPVIFPQFNERGPGMRHGFARVSDWALVDSGSDGGAAFAVFALEPHDLAAERAQAWPHDFLLQLRVRSAATSWRWRSKCTTAAPQPFAFSSALHTYHLVDQVGDVRIDGLQDGPLAIGDTLDEIFYDIDGRITLHAGAGALRAGAGWLYRCGGVEPGRGERRGDGRTWQTTNTSASSASSRR